jgi:hypothetical protein
MSDDIKDCDLCGLAVETQGFELNTRQGHKAFCCEGCKGIYQMLHEEEILPEENADPQLS